MTFPILIKKYTRAVEELQRLSLICDFPLYLFRKNEGGYVIDFEGEVNSNEKLVMKIFKGETL